MRRKDKEITDIEKIQEIMEGCHCCRIGLCDQGIAYIVPLNFGYDLKDNSFTIYFHSGKEGRKMDLIEKSHQVSFEMDRGHQLKRDEMACSHSARYQSIMGTGNLEIIRDVSGKTKALNLIMGHETGQYEWDYSQEALDGTAVFKIQVLELTAKESK